MGDKITLSLFIFLVVIVPGIIGIMNPEIMVRTTGINALKKKPSRSQIKRYRTSSYGLIIIGLFIILAVFLGGFKGV